MKNKILFLVFSVIMLSLGACNTLEGAGRDVENVGKGIQDAIK